MTQTNPKGVLIRLLALAGLILAAACTPRPGAEALLPAVATEGATVMRIHVATTRAPLAAPSIGFSSRPTATPSYRYYDISVPPEPREDGVYWRTDAPDPQHDFLVVGHGRLGRAEFLESVARAEADNALPESTVFVHGYNFTFAEALLRLAKLSSDAGLAVPPVLFSWPSKGRPLEYIADREEAQISRDALAGLLHDLDRRQGEVALVAHSMGAWLSMEALRSLALAGDRRTVRDTEVLLIAPDIDVLVFNEQLRALGPRDTPITVLVSPDDRALRLSSRLSTRRPRLGAVDVHDPRVLEAARSAEVQLIDISALEPENAMRHNRYMRLARMYQTLQNDGRAFDVVTAAGGYVLNSLGTGIVQVGASLTGN